LRSALDVDDLMLDWKVAVDAGFLAIDGRRARAAAGLARTDTDFVLSSWVGVAAEQCLGVPEEPCPGCLVVLDKLMAADGPVSVEELVLALAEAAPDMASEEPCADCGQIHDPAVLSGIGDLLGIGDFAGDEDLEEDHEEHAGATVAGLAAFGAAVAAEGAVRLTPLGNMLAASVLEGCAPLPDAGVAELVSVLSEVPLPVAATMARPWLEARPAEAAVGELLAFAESASGGLRIAALAFARQLGPAGMAAWQERAKRPGFGAYARQFLAEQGEQVTLGPSDEAWLAVDALSIMLDSITEMMLPFPLAAILQEEPGADVGAVVSALRGSGHPAEADVVARLTGRPALTLLEPGRPVGQTAAPGRRSPASGPRGGLYQLKISLRGVSNPPVWRRVVVPADVTLEQLHLVIMQAMGWDGGHMHVFSAGWQVYGQPNTELGHADEAAVRLWEVLSAPRDRLEYTYDFGDDWEHEVLLEQALPGNSGGTISCLAGKGMCPPDDCGGAWGYADLKKILADPGHEQHQEMLDWLGLAAAEEFDPGAFSTDEVNARLGGLI